MSTDISLIQELESVENKLLARLRELAPLVAEHHELMRIAQRLGLDVEGPDPTRSESSPAPSISGRAAGGDVRGRVSNAKPKASARGGKAAAQEDAAPMKQKRVVATVRATPGLTVAEVAGQLGVDAASLYPVVRKLTKEHVLVKRGRTLYLRD
jgi:hypothetical protein